MIFGSTYLEDYWELVVHIDTAEASGRVLHANHVSNKFLSELKYNLWGNVSAKKCGNSSNFNQDFYIARGYRYRITGRSIDLNTTCELFFLAPVSRAADSTSTLQRNSDKLLIFFRESPR